MTISIEENLFEEMNQEYGLEKQKLENIYARKLTEREEYELSNRVIAFVFIRHSETDVAITFFDNNRPYERKEPRIIKLKRLWRLTHNPLVEIYLDKSDEIFKGLWGYAKTLNSNYNRAKLRLEDFKTYCLVTLAAYFEKQVKSKI